MEYTDDAAGEPPMTGRDQTGRPLPWPDAPPPPPWSSGWYGGTPPLGGPPLGTPWGAPPTPPRRRRPVSAVVTILAVVVAVVAGLAVGRSLPRSTPSSNGNAGSFTAPPAGGGEASGGSPSTGSPSTGSPSAPGSATVAAIAAKVDPGLVDIDTQLGYQDLAAAGTGIVLSADGLVLTNNHVINGSTVIRVTDIGNKKVYTATVVGYDESADIAVIRLKGASRLATATLGNSNSAVVGQSVVAIGNAGGAGGTPSAAGGSVTALNQAITASDSGDGTSEQLRGLIQTDADVQPGDSGGSLVDTAGRVIGVDTAASAGFSFSGGAGAEGFAIPINSAIALGRQITAGSGSSTVHIGPTAFLGVSFSSSAGSLSDTVSGVIAGTAAERAGIAPGDIITSLGGAEVTAPGDLTRALVAHHPGDHVVVVWKTGQGQTRQATVTLTAGPNA